MKDIKQMVHNDIMTLLCEKQLNDKELAVVGVLSACWGTGHVTQQEIAEHRFWKNAVKSNASIDTIRRDIRRVIRKLRVHYKLPILHDETGHFLPETKEDLQNFIERLEAEAKKRATSSMETYKVMKETLGISSPLFEELDFIGTQLIRQV